MFRSINSESTISRSLKILSKSDQRKLLIITVILVVLGVMDLFGVLAIGLLGTLSINGIQSQQPGTRVG